jgi:hypothetical protein
VIDGGGNVGIYGGNVALSGKHAFRGSDSWLRLNQDRAFTSGVHTPGLFYPGSLNVGGIGGGSDPGSGNVAVAGNVGVGTTSPQWRLHVTGDIYANGGWLRVSGNQGLHFESYGGGWFMQDPTWIRNYNGKPLYIYGNGGTAAAFDGGNVGIGTSSPSGKLHVAGGNAIVDGNVGIGTSNPQQRLHVAGPFIQVDGAGGNEQAYMGGDGGGNVQFGTMNSNIPHAVIFNRGSGRVMDIRAANFIRSSDGRLKTNVAPLSDALEKLMQIRGVSFEWNSLAPSTGHEPGQRDVGVIAQEVEAVFPELVTTTGQDGYKALDYSRLTPVLIEAVKTLKAEIEQLKTEKDQEIQALSTRIRMLEQNVKGSAK